MLCLLSLGFFAAPGRTVARPGGYWQDTYYSDNGRLAHSDFIPQTEFSVMPGHDSAPGWLPLALLAAGAFWVRRGPTAAWVRYGLVALSAIVALNAVEALTGNISLGALLYALGAVPIGAAGWRLLRGAVA